MTTIYTRTGDGGETSLPDGARTGKDDPRIELFGALDEANCAIGFARVHVVDSSLDAWLEFLQHRLFNCGACALGEKPVSGAPRVSAEDVAALETAIDHYSSRAGGSMGFVLPGCDEASGRLHLARVAMRRAERAAVRACATGPVTPEVLAFLNRASDLLFIAARWTGAGSECAWRPDAEPPPY
jgi:cob(I)alamin adenosyltransferase